MNDTQPATGPTDGSVDTDPELVRDDRPAPPGRPVRLVPTPPGFTRVLLGAVVALLGPFFGILIGSTVGSTDSAGRMDPLYWGFFIGGLIGILGLVMASFGAVALIRHSRSRTAEEER